MSTAIPYMCDKFVAVLVLALSGADAVCAQGIPGALPDSIASLQRGEWPAYAGTYAAARYSPLAQIDRSNAKDLRIVWNRRAQRDAHS